MAENAIVRLVHPGLHDFGEEIGDAGADETVVEVHVGGTGEEVLEFCGWEKKGRCGCVSLSILSIFAAQHVCAVPHSKHTSPTMVRTHEY